MALFDRVGYFDPTAQQAFDSTLPGNGAVEFAGVSKWRVHPSGVTFGLQGYRYFKNEVDGTLTAGLGYLMNEAETATLGASAGALWGAALTTPINLFCGVASAALLDNAFGWFQVWGQCTLVTIAGNTVDGAKIEPAANGTVDDTVGTGQIIGIGLATGTSGASLSVMLAIKSPP
jgi:hypothetical protein